MKNLSIILVLFISLFACDESTEIKEVIIGYDQGILDEYFITSIAFDSEGTAWIGTFEQGLINYRSGEVIVYNSSNSVLPDKKVINDIAIDSKDNIWIGCEGLIRFDGNEFSLYTTENSDIPEDYVASVSIDSKDNIWFTSCRFRTGGIVKYDGMDMTVYTPENSDLPVNFVHCIAIDKSDRVWLALSEIVNDAYLVRINGDQWDIYTGNELGFSPYYLGDIEINGQNNLVGAVNYSLSSIYYNIGPKIFSFDGDSGKSYENDSLRTVRLIAPDKDNKIWFAGFSEYGYIDKNTWKIDNTSLTDRWIFAMEHAPDGAVWIGTGQGIYIVSP